MWTPGRWTLTLTLAAAALATLPIGAAAEPPAPPPPKDESPQKTADRLLEKAQSAGEAALAWLERQTGVTGKDVADTAVSAEESLRRAIADAVERAGDGREPAVRLLEPGATPERLSWQLVDADIAATALPQDLVLLVHGID